MALAEKISIMYPGVKGINDWSNIKSDTLKQSGDKYDEGKVRYSLIPPIAMKSMAEILTFGAEKYMKDGWKDVENAEERYLDALYRHLEAFRGGEKVDPESGKSHLAHAITNVAFLLYFEEENNVHREL